jgi:hypothetical protein
MKNQSLYRYMGLPELVDWLYSGQLRFADPRSWDDPFEVYPAISRQAQAQQPARSSHCLYVKSFSRSASSEALWHIYSPHRTGVRVTVERRGLQQAATTLAERHDAEARLAPVRYKAGYEIEKDLEGQLTAEEFFQSAFLKRRSFQHEQEVRLVIAQPVTCRMPPRHRRYPVDIGVIRSIYVDPRATERTLDRCRRIAKDAGLRGIRVDRSALFEAPLHRQ